MGLSVLLVAYRRPESTLRQLSELAKVGASQVYISVDGGASADIPWQDLLRATLDGLDSSMHVHQRILQDNRGLQYHIPDAISWALEASDRLVILEDDCIPGSSFYEYVSALLDTHHNDESVAMISGNRFGTVQGAIGSTYVPSRHGHIWGWATWRRAWHNYDEAMSDWPALGIEWLAEEIFPGDRAAATHWTSILDAVYSGSIRSWAYRWTYSCWRNDSVALLPEVNLVRNVGEDRLATNTRRLNAHVRATGVGTMLCPPHLVHQDLRPDLELDRQINRDVFGVGGDRWRIGSLRARLSHLRRH